MTCNNNQRQLSGCTFQWRVKNSFAWLYPQPIESPTFVAEALQSTTWMLRLHAKGLKTVNYLGCSLYRVENCNGPDSIKINFELAFLSTDGIPLVSEGALEKQFLKGSSYGFELETSRTILTEKRAEYLPNEVLIVQCKIWNETENGGMLMIFGSTTERTEKCSFIWNIDSFSSFESRQEREFVIKSLSGKKLITLVFSVILGRFGKEAFEVNCKDFDKDIKTCTIKSLLLSNGMHFTCDTEISIFDHFVISKIILPFSKEVLMDMKPDFFPGDTLSLRFHCVFSYGIFTKSIDTIDCGATSSVTVPVRKYVIEQEWENNLADSSCSLRNDMELLLESELFSDVEIRTKSRKFSAHKSILSSRSPVFKALFTKSTDQNSKVDISNFEDSTVLGMLHYMYTDTIRERDFEKMLCLYNIAFKFEIKSLQEKCLALLKSKFYYSNVCEILLSTESLPDELLKNAVFQYISQNEAKVYRAQEWKDLVASHPLLALEVMQYKWKN